jgi:hypothetical protein
MAAMMCMGNNFLSRLHADHADAAMIIRKDCFLIALGIIKLLQFLYIDYLRFHSCSFLSWSGGWPAIAYAL